MPVIWALVWMVPPPSERVKVTVAFAYPWPPASRDLTPITMRWAAASCSTMSTVPVNVMDIAPILTLISALTDSGPVFSSTEPPSTQGIVRSRSRIAA